MNKITWATLRLRLAEQYGDLRSRLTRRLGSDDLACEALHDAYLRLEAGEVAAPVHRVKGYLFRAALNAGIDRQRVANRLATRSEVEGALELSDDAPVPEVVAEARQELAALELGLAELPERRRAILIAARLEGVPHAEIARSFGISTRMVQFEIMKALEHLLGRCGK